MITGRQSALSGLQAFATKIENNANNVANQNPERFKKESAVLPEQVPQGVRTTVERVNPPGVVLAEQTGLGLEMIEPSKVDLGEEFSNLMRNTHGYKANLKTLQTADDMMQTVLDIKA